MRKAKAFEKELVELAIEELKATNQKVNLLAITKLTGYNYSALQKHGYGNLAHPRRSQVSSDSQVDTPSDLECVQVDANLEAYKAHILDSYFSKPSTVSSVKSQMANEIANYNPTLCSTAINQLIVEGKLQSQGTRPDHYVSNLEIAEPVITHLVLDAEGVSHKCYSHSSALELAKRLAITTPGEKVHIFAAAQVIKAELSITIQ